MMRKGRFISFEGGEGAGKTTLIRKIEGALIAKGEKTLLTRAPGGTPMGSKIRSILLESPTLEPKAELFLFLSDRAQHFKDVIEPALKNGITVLCDRFNDSTVAYQSGGRAFDPAWIRKLCLFATENQEPDTTLFLDLDPEIGLKRLARGKDRIEEEKLSFHRAVRASYLAIAKEEAKRFHVIDANRPAEEVFEDALALL